MASSVLLLLLLVVMMMMMRRHENGAEVGRVVLVAQHAHHPMHPQPALDRQQRRPLLLRGTQAPYGVVHIAPQLRAAFGVVGAIEQNAPVAMTQPLDAPGPAHTPDASRQTLLVNRCTNVSPFIMQAC
jgi:hypothetical protein